MTTLPGRSPATFRRPSPPPHADPGVVGNARLTGMTAVVLFVLLAAEGVTILGIRRLLPEHAFYGAGRMVEDGRRPNCGPRRRYRDRIAPSLITPKLRR